MRAVGRLNHRADGLISELRLVFLRNLRGDLVRRRRIHQQAAAAAESTAGKTSPIDFGNRLRRINDRIQLLSGVLEPVAARLVRIVHQRTEALEVALREKGRTLENALVLANRMDRPLRRRL